MRRNPDRPVPAGDPSGNATRSSERFESECRRRGLRVTPQRLAVYRALAEDGSHPTAESVTDRVRRRMPSVSPATVYRVLESLEKESLIRRVSSTGGAARFDANTLPHQHLVCRDCGSITDVSIPSLGKTSVPRGAAARFKDFEIEHLDIRIVGLCSGCTRSARSTPGARRIVKSGREPVKKNSTPKSRNTHKGRKENA